MPENNKLTSLLRNGSLKAIIFDFDGTIADTYKITLEYFQHNFTKEGIDIDLTDKDVVDSLFDLIIVSGV